MVTHNEAWMAQPTTPRLETAWLLELAEKKQEYLPQLKTVCLERNETERVIGEDPPRMLSQEQLQLVLEEFGRAGIFLTGLSDIPEMLAKMEDLGLS